MSHVTCPCCYATSFGTAPHGNEMPCPSAIALRDAEIAERKAHAALYEAQRDATLNSPKRI